MTFRFVRWTLRWLPVLFPALALAQQPEPTPRRWYVPQHAVAQVAGGIGMVAGGVGYTVGYHRRLDVDVLGGYVPAKYTSGAAFGIFTLKGTYSPFSLPVVSRWRLKPLSVGALVSHTPAASISRSRDNKYDPGYYWWSSRTRLGAFVGGRLSRALPTDPARRVKRQAAFYYELGTNELYAVSFIQNPHGLPFHKILTLGLGLKVDL